MTYLPATLRKTLDATGLDWRVEHGARHLKLYVAGRLAGILPRGTKGEAHQRSLLNTRAQIRRIAREATQESQP